MLRCGRQACVQLLGQTQPEADKGLMLGAFLIQGPLKHCMFTGISSSVVHSSSVTTFLHFQMFSLDLRVDISGYIQKSVAGVW